jgi:hypothetical protein
MYIESTAKLANNCNFGGFQSPELRKKTVKIVQIFIVGFQCSAKNIER